MGGLRSRCCPFICQWKLLTLMILGVFCLLEAPRISSWLADQQPFISGNLPYHQRQMLQMNRALWSDTTADPLKNQSAEPGNVHYADLDESASLDNWMAHRKKVYEARQRRVEEVCRRYNVTSSTETMSEIYRLHANNDFGLYIEHIERSQFLLARSSHLMGCFINKVASSSFVKTFLILQGLQMEKVVSPHAYRSRLVPQSDDEMEFSRDNFFKVMFVRHPMERLVSCYYDKMVVNPHKSLVPFRKNVMIRAHKIMDLRRQMEVRELASSSQAFVKANLTRLDFAVRRAKREDAAKDRQKSAPVRTLLSRSQKNGSEEVAKLAEEAPVIPTFEEFLEYILSTKLQGEGFHSHWVPYWTECTPCSFKYDMIGTLETGNDDFTYLWKHTGIDMKAPIPWEHVGTRGKNDEAEKHREKLKSYYQSVTRELLIRVYDAFKLDFDLFGYDFNEVLHLAGYKQLQNNEI